MKKLLVVVAAFCGLVFLAPSALAQDNTAPAAMPQHGKATYGLAGCGLGSMVFGNQPGFVQIFAATTNGLFGTQTFGITSGTSNCTNTSGGTMSAKAFIQTNREALAKDISRGSGETIDSLSSLAGCSSSAQVGTALQKNFQSIFPTAQVTDQQVSDSVVHVLQSDTSLACHNLG